MSGTIVRLLRGFITIPPQGFRTTILLEVTVPTRRGLITLVQRTAEVIMVVAILVEDAPLQVEEEDK